MQKVQSLPEIGFKGINNSDKPEFLQPGYVQLVEDGLIIDNQIEKGPGTSRLFNIGTSKSMLGGCATASEIYVALNEPGDTLAFIYRYTGSGNPVVVSGANLTADTNVEFVSAGTATYVLNGTTATGKLVTTTYSQPAGLPIGKYGAWVNNRLYIAGNSTYPSRLYYSDANAPDTFGGSSYIDIFPSDRSNITGLAVLGGVLIIMKQDNIVTFTGYTEDDFTVKKLTETLPNFGCVSHRSIINTGDDLLWMSYAGNTPHIRSLKRTSFDKINYGGTITENIEGTMRDLNTSRLNMVAGGFDGRFCYWSVPTSTSSSNDYVIVYDTFKKEIVGFSIGMSASVYFRSTITGDDRLYYGSADEISSVLAIIRGFGARDGETMMFKIKSRRYRPASNRKAKFKYLFVTTGEDTNTSILVEASPDGFTFETQETISPVTNGSVFPMTFPFYFGVSQDRKNRVDLRGTNTAYAYEVQISESSSAATTTQVFPLTFPITFGSTSNVIVKEWDLMYYPRGLRDQ